MSEWETISDDGWEDVPKQPVSNVNALASGINRGVANLAGLPMDTIRNVFNLGISGYGSLMNLSGRPDLAPAPIEPSEYALGSDWFSRQMDKLAGGNATRNPSPQDPAARTLFTGGEFFGSSLAPGQSIPQTIIRAAIPAAGAGVAAGTFPDQPLAPLIGALAPSAAAMSASSATKSLFRGGEAGRQKVQQNIDTFKDAGTTPTAGQAAGGASNAIEQYLGRAPGGIHVVSRKGEALAREVGGRTSQISQGVSPVTERSEAGRAIQSGIEGFVGRFKNQWRGINSKLDQHFSPQDGVDMTNTQSSLAKLTAKIRGAEKTSEKLINPKLAELHGSLVDDISSSQGKLPYEAVRDLRTMVGERIASSGLTDDVSKGEWKNIYGALSSDLKAAAAQKGGNALNTFNRSNQFYSSGMQRIEGQLENISKKVSPEEAYRAAVSGAKEGGTRLWALRRSLKPGEWNQVVSTVVDRLGLAVPSKQDATGEMFSTETFLSNWNNISKQAKGALFGEGTQLRRDLDKVAQAASVIRESGKIYANPSGTGLASGTIGAGGVAIGSALAGSFGITASIIGAMTVNNMTARLMTNPKFVHWLAQSTTLKPEKAAEHIKRLAVISQTIEDPNERDDMTKLLNTLGQNK